MPKQGQLLICEYETRYTFITDNRLNIFHMDTLIIFRPPSFNTLKILKF
jgi:hypothetical protein